MAIMKSEFLPPQRTNFGSIVTLNVEMGVSDKITSAVTTIDQEIKMLEQRFSKTVQIKLGMMPELLTGKTRSVQRSASA